MSAVRTVQKKVSKKRAKSRDEEARLAKKRIELMKRDPAYAEATFAGADAGTFVEDDDYLDDEPPPTWRKRKVLLGLILVPVCILAVVTLFELFFRETVEGKFWKSEGFWFFTFGCLLWFALGWMRMQPAWLYVFAHEFTHAITARLSGGHVHAMHVTEEGGYIETDKTSMLITLSPYLVPLYTVLVFALYGLLSLFVDMNQDVILTMPITGGMVWMKWVWLIYFFVGLTWCFHITFTLEVLRTEQSDLAQNGEFFSIMLIFVANFALVGALFIAASPTLGWREVWHDAQATVNTVWRWIQAGIAAAKSIQ